MTSARRVPLVIAAFFAVDALMLALGLLFLCLSLDEVAMIHERLGTREGGYLHRTGTWMFVIGIPVLGVFAVLIRSAAARLRRAPDAFLRIAIGLAVVALGAMVFDLFANFSVGATAR